MKTAGPNCNRTAINHCQKDKSHDMSVTSHANGTMIILRMPMLHKTRAIVQVSLCEFFSNVFTVSS